MHRNVILKGARVREPDDAAAEDLFAPMEDEDLARAHAVLRRRQTDRDQSSGAAGFSKRRAECQGLELTRLQSHGTETPVRPRCAPER